MATGGSRIVTTLRTIAAHEIVQRIHPRPPPTDRDEIAMAAGRAVDGTLAQLGYDSRRGRRTTAAALRATGEQLLDGELMDGGVRISPSEREVILTQLRGVVREYRRSVLFGLTRPKARVIVIDGRVGVYVQPDYWNGRARIFEMKSYPAIPPREEVALQLRLFQIGFPGFEAMLVCINRHSVPVSTTSAVIPPPTPEAVVSTLRTAFDLGMEFGMEKVLEYMPGPFVHYPLPPGPPGGG
ncbi:MAG: hypothetical protein ACREC5_04390 [Thermoplasmata archaeon]